MTEMKPAACATVIGDVVDSRRAPDRAALHHRLTAALATANTRHRPATALGVTVGDEFQGVFDTVGQALEAAFTLWLALLPDVDVRFGIGWGRVSVLDPAAGTQDGPGWWAARDAIQAVAAGQAGPTLRRVRTAYRLGEGAAGPAEAAVTAALLCRDHMVGSLDTRSLTILKGLMDGRTQAELADAEGISASAVSQRVRGDGLALLLEAQARLSEVR